MTPRALAAVVLAGVAGLSVAFLVGAVLFDQIFLIVLIVAPHLFLFAIALAAVIPALQRVLPGSRGAVLALFPLTIGAQLVWLAMGFAEFNDPIFFFLSLVFAAAAVLVHRLVAGRYRYSGSPAGS
ncbi:MAG: hypothetical protein RLN99_09465 [Kiloniellaceae bacterium]